MADSQLGWSEAQWEKINNAVTEAFGKASVASEFLTCFGPLAGNVETVRNERLAYNPTSNTVSLDGDAEDATQKLINLTVKVELSSEQIADESLSSALLAFRRAASILAVQEDDIVFSGFDPSNKKVTVVANAPGRKEGLGEKRAHQFQRLEDLRGRAIVSAVVAAIRELEENLHPGPFACVMGNALFESAHRATPSLVLPADRITPLLKGPLLRSGGMDDYTGIVVSLASTVIDIVVGTPPTVQFLQRTAEARFLFRVYERFVLRVRDTANPVAGFTIIADASPKAVASVASADAEAVEAKRAEGEAAEANRLAETYAEGAKAAESTAEALRKTADDAAGKVASAAAAAEEDPPPPLKPKKN